MKQSNITVQTLCILHLVIKPPGLVSHSLPSVVAMEVARRAVVVLRVAHASLARGRDCFGMSVQRTREFMGIASRELMLAQTIAREATETVPIEGQIVVIALALQFLLDSPRVSGDALVVR